MTLTFEEYERQFDDGFRIVEESLNEFKEDSLFDDYMEAFGKKKDGSNNKEKESNSSNKTPAEAPKASTASEKSTNGLMKMWNAIMGMIKKLQETVREFFARRNLKEDERKAYDAFREAAKKDPALANKKITVASFQKTQEEYQKLCDEIEKEEERVIKDSNRNIEPLGERVANFIKTAGKGVLLSVNATGLTNIASMDREAAMFVDTMLHADQKRMEKLRGEMGSKAFSKMEKDIRCQTKRMSLRKWRLGLHKKQFQTVSEAYGAATKSLLSLASGSQKLADDVSNIAGSDEKLPFKAAKIASRVHKTTGDAVNRNLRKNLTSAVREEPFKAAAAAIEPELKMAKRTLVDPAIRGGMQGVGDAAGFKAKRFVKNKILRKNETNSEVAGEQQKKKTFRNLRKLIN